MRQHLSTINAAWSSSTSSTIWCLPPAPVRTSSANSSCTETRFVRSTLWIHTLKLIPSHSCKCYVPFQRIRLEAHVKFSVLWHLTRDLNMTKSSFNRTFDRYVSLRVMLHLKKHKCSSCTTCLFCESFVLSHLSSGLQVSVHHAWQSKLLGSMYKRCWSWLAESGPSETWYCSGVGTTAPHFAPP